MVRGHCRITYYYYSVRPRLSLVWKNQKFLQIHTEDGLFHTGPTQLDCCLCVFLIQSQMDLFACKTLTVCNNAKHGVILSAYLTKYVVWVSVRLTEGSVNFCGSVILLLPFHTISSWAAL